MSASSKKKLRNAQEAEKLTEKQLKEKHEAKKLNIMTATFVVVLALMVAFAAYTGISNHIAHKGTHERNAIAMTVGDHEISNAELSFYYIDEVQKFLQQYGSYAAMFGLDVTKPLDQQITNKETGATWADDFLESAKTTAKETYALTDEAAKQGFELSEAEKTYIDTSIKQLDQYAKMQGHSNGENYLKAMYGNGATVEGYRTYATMTTLAHNFQNHYATSLEYTDSDLREAEKENYAEYSSFSYNSYYVEASKFLEGGTKGENDTITYSEEERAAALERAEEAAKSLVTDKIDSVPALDKAIAELDINKNIEHVSSTAYTDHPYSNINTVIRDWVTDDAREAGDLTYIPSTRTSADKDGKEVTTTNGYYVVYFNDSNDNAFPLLNVRHILIQIEGGKRDEKGNVTFTDEEKAAAKEKAEAILADWKAGEATEDSFAALAKEKSKDTASAVNGGLCKDIYPNQMVKSFNDWCFDKARQPGDTDIVESEFGYHIMYFSGESETTFRDYQIKNALISNDTSEWFKGLVDAVTVTDGDVKYINKGLVLSLKG